MEKFRIIPGTDGKFGINEAGTIKNLKRDRIVRPFRPGTVKLIRYGKRSSIRVEVLIEEVFAPGYVSDEPDKMQNIKAELIRIRNSVNRLLKDIERDERIS